MSSGRKPTEKKGHSQYTGFIYRGRHFEKSQLLKGGSQKCKTSSQTIVQPKHIIYDCQVQNK